MPAFMLSSDIPGQTVPELDSGHAEGIPALIGLAIVSLIVAFVCLIGFIFKKISRSRANSSNESTTPRHQRIINATRAAIPRLRPKSIQTPEAAHILSSLAAGISAPRPPLSNSTLPAVHLVGENASMTPEASPPKYRRHAFRERLPKYESLIPNEPRRETRGSRHDHRTARRSREDRLMRSMLANPYGINRHMAHSNGEEDGVEGSSSVSATASSWMLLAADLEERAEENE